MMAPWSKRSPRAGLAASRCMFGSSPRSWSRSRSGWHGAKGATRLKLLSDLILRALTALAAPLVVLAILSAIVTNEIKGRLGALMMAFYLLNTLVAMIIGLSLTNLIRPGIGASLSGPAPRLSPRRRNRSPT